MRRKTLKQSKKQTHLHNRELLKDIGLRFKLMRLEMSLKAVEVAEKLEISKQLLSNFENGKSNNLLLAIYYSEVLAQTKACRELFDNIIKGKTI